MIVETATLKSLSPVLRNPFNKGRAIPLDKKQFHYAFGNTMRRTRVARTPVSAV
jgi:hypothetical protein